jgi:radical SAM protein with 4Fe4S-binding SPASM domain
MPNIRYALRKLQTDIFLSGISERFRSGKNIPPPSYVLWDCTRRCNLRCAHCGASKETYPQELSTAQILPAVDELAAMRTGMFAVTGGEPLLRADLLDVLAHARSKGLKTGIASNGFFLDEKTADRIRDAGVHSVQISLDGPEPVHNRIRGNPESFGRAVRAIELILRRRIPVVSAATTVTSENLDQLDALHGILRRTGIGMWRLAVVMPIGRARTADTALDGGRLVSLFGFVQRHDRKGMRIYLGENLTHLGAWEQTLRGGPVVCPVGFLALCIGVDGHVRGCPEMPDTPSNREGSILEQPLSEIWRRGFGRYRRREILAADSDCSGCGWKHDCYGGCWVMRDAGRHCIRRAMEDASPSPA